MNKRKKNTRMKAKTTHGYGSMKKNRGAGNRGGRGNAGSGKRGDAKKQIYQKIKGYFGKKGFVKHGQKKEIKPINIYDIEIKIEKWLVSGKAIKEKDFYSIDLNKLGYNKLLGKGKPSRNYKILVKYATSMAKEKINNSGEIITD